MNVYGPCLTSGPAAKHCRATCAMTMMRLCPWNLEPRSRCLLPVNNVDAGITRCVIGWPIGIWSIWIAQPHVSLNPVIHSSFYLGPYSGYLSLQQPPTLGLSSVCWLPAASDPDFISVSGDNWTLPITSGVVFVDRPADDWISSDEALLDHRDLLRDISSTDSELLAVKLLKNAFC